MKIYFVIRDFWTRGGTEFFCRRLVAGLSGRDVRVKVITTRKSFFQKLPNKFNGAQVVSLYVPRVRLAGTMFYCMQLSMYLVLHFYEYSAIQVFFLKHAALMSSFWGRLLNKKVVCRLSGGGLYGDMSSLKKAPLLRCFFAVFNEIDIFVVMSTSMQTELAYAGFPEKKIRLIPNGVDVSAFSLPHDRDAIKDRLGLKGRKVFIFTGRLSEEKGLDCLLDAFSCVKVAGKQLVIVGGGRLFPELKKKAGQPGLTGTVHFTGFRENVIPFLKAADVFVLPSFSEGLSNSLLEAMACGLPAVATRVSGNLDVICDGVNGFLVAPGNAREMASAMEKIALDESLAKSMSGAARQKIVQHYSMGAVVERYRDLYCRIAGKHD